MQLAEGLSSGDPAICPAIRLCYLPIFELLHPSVRSVTALMSQEKIIGEGATTTSCGTLAGSAALREDGLPKPSRPWG